MKRIIFLSVIYITRIASDGSSDSTQNLDTRSKLEKKYNIDFKTKSAKGWLRVFNSKAKMKKRGLVLSKEELNYIIKELKKDLFKQMRSKIKKK